jgi:hypothetical protein
MDPAFWSGVRAETSADCRKCAWEVLTNHLKLSENFSHAGNRKKTWDFQGSD